MPSPVCSPVADSPQSPIPLERKARVRLRMVHRCQMRPIHVDGRAVGGDGSLAHAFSQAPASQAERHWRARDVTGDQRSQWGGDVTG